MGMYFVHIQSLIIGREVGRGRMLRILYGELILILF